MHVNEVLNKKGINVITAGLDMKLREAMKILISNKISCLPVLNSSDDLVGIISDKDIFKAIYNNAEAIDEAVVENHMTTNLIVGLIDDDINFIAGLMTKNKIRHIPIMENDKLSGVLSVGDIVKVQMTDMEVENRYLKDYIDGAYPG